ncbi:hypothetical protein BO99DRAFT_409716 [Aspergillus violaceofuscus CBS 115571]|uniref:tRNA-intron lyase n=1 Tax=Aspergillus violaceofuscus (strain CBS 115571) TaxID=1450538 RepID=A0A2V5HF25_ASPV1|nr:hypothetical protein BO99DRAFT_409716 [Aspergillus violaceofuscus CBS 115571]
MASSSPVPSSSPGASSGPASIKTASQTNASPARRPRPPRPNYKHIHRFPFPVDVHPLPPLIPHNPLSIVSVLLSYLTYLIAPPQQHVYTAYFDSATSSVHVTDPEAIRALWEMGFFGKGNLSRSEPSWLEREKKRRGMLGGTTSEEVTRQRRTERRELKMDRARMEKLAIQERLKAEAAARQGDNSSVEQPSQSPPADASAEKFSLRKAKEARLLDSQRSIAQNGEVPPLNTPGEQLSNGSGKTVRFSPVVQAKEFISDSAILQLPEVIAEEDKAGGAEEEPALQNEEHLHLSNEEAFFLAYGLGALTILDDTREAVITTSTLLPLFCQHADFPPRGPSSEMKPDDTFLISYVVYHHFRSLGWVVRSGVKFGVDYLLYNRGPVFSHAEFAVVVIPSYTDSYWSETEERRKHCEKQVSRSWWWLHCVNRVQAQVKKSLVVCYVEVPPPAPKPKFYGVYGTMETQEDSIDIARLQRVALGQQLPADDKECAQKPSEPVSTTSSSSLAQNGASVSSPKLPSFEDRPSSRAATQLGKMGSAETLPSDTQLISQRVYDEIIRKNQEEGPVMNHDSNMGDQATLMTLHEGDSGHLDLLAGYDNVNAELVNIDDNDDRSSSKLGESSPAQYQSNLFPESQRFVMKTPATAVKRAHSDGLTTISPTVLRNPLATDIGSSGGIMALSQVFRATQAPSSPLVNRQQHSDLVSDRPSPNIPIQKHPLAANLSSPYDRMAATFPRDSSAHKLNYISMQESQANRDKLLNERMTRSADHVFPGDPSDDDFGKEPSFVERMIRHRTIDEEIAPQLAGLTAPARSEGTRSRQASKGSLSPQGDLGLQVWNDESAAENDGEQRAASDPTVPQRGGSSEEETEQEQEDHRGQSIPPSEEHISVTEEDKENCLDLAATPVAATTSAHDRLSQVLAFDGSTSPAHASPEKQQLQPHLARNITHLDEPYELSRSSQISIVKDSQRSPRQREADAEVETNRSRRTSHCPDSQVQIYPTSDIDRIISSPTKQVRMQSSPPAESRRLGLSFELGEVQGMNVGGSISGSPQRSPTPKATQAPEGSLLDSSNTMSQQPRVVGDKPSTFDFQGKSSSMPSRVAETPVPPMDLADVVPTTSIPETSPNRLGNQGWPTDMNNNETADQEDDDLPPVYQVAHERASHSHQVVLNSTSPLKPSLTSISKLLSSPSGRQRRALTEIAADASPKGGTGAFNPDIDIMSADDWEFNAAVARHQDSPRKKRRGNDGQGVIASDPILPGTLRLTSRLVPPQPVSQGLVEPATTRTVTEVQMGMQPDAQQENLQSKAAKAYQRRSRPPRSADSVWDMDDSPPRTFVPRKNRTRLLPRPQPLNRQRPVETERGGSPSKERPGIAQQRQAISPVPEESRSDITSQDPIETSPTGSPATDSMPTVEPAMPSLTEKVPVAANQVFAPWCGAKRAYYPATCFGKPFGTSQSRYRVKFEDSAPVDIPMGAIKRLELRPGDAVKVDMPNVPKVTHVIRSFVRKLSIDEIEQGAANGVIPMTDIYGYSAVMVGPKQRKSLPNAGLAVTESLIEVPISKIYLDTILWNQLKDRSFTYISEPVFIERGAPTPSEKHSTPISSPGARLSRSIRFSNGLFAGMVFAVSFGDNNDAKARVVKLILENDGRILEDGFNELFDLPLNAPVATPTKQPPTKSNTQHDLLQLSSSAADVGFACLIADRHSRRSKYMQALALNLPCLSDRWVEDCVARGRIIDWEIYLLPAGESTYLNGATKSRILTPYPATEARLSETIAGRPNLLNGQSVLLVTGRSGRIDEERRKAYLFLTYALGASRIERVSDLKSARAILNAQTEEGHVRKRGWDWIYIDDDDKPSARAMALSSAGVSGSGSTSRKRKRTTKLMESVTGDDLGLSTNVRIVGNEFVCQSLILGRLFDQ